MNKYLNIGCGGKFNKKWINIDFYSNSKNVIKHNILKGLPFPDNSIDFIYNCHFLEHLTKIQAIKFLKECRRVLKEKGVIRLVVPDLENICTEYLKILEEVKIEKKLMNKLEFIKIELLDQMTRMKSGGLLGDYFDKSLSENEKEYFR